MISNCKKEEPLNTFQIFEAGGNVPQIWDQFLPENHPLKISNIVVYEASTNINGIYLIAYLGGQVVGLFYFQQTTIPVKKLDFSDFNFFKISLLLN